MAASEELDESLERAEQVEDETADPDVDEVDNAVGADNLKTAFQERFQKATRGMDFSDLHKIDMAKVMHDEICCSLKDIIESHPRTFVNQARPLPCFLVETPNNLVRGRH
jgi:hypothetical protein